MGIGTCEVPHRNILTWRDINISSFSYNPVWHHSIDWHYNDLINGGYIWFYWQGLECVVVQLTLQQQHILSGKRWLIMILDTIVLGSYE